MKKQLLSITVVFLFVFLALASKVNKIGYNAFNYSNRVEEVTDKGNYVLKNDGSRIYGRNISYKSGLLVKDHVKIDEAKFPMKEITGFMENNIFYLRQGDDFIQRIVHGKINIYVKFVQVTETSTNQNGFSRSRTYMRTYHYSQLGDQAPLVAMTGQKDIKKLVADCPLAVEMASLKNSKMRKAIRKNPNYLNSIFEIYNKGCKE